MGFSLLFACCCWLVLDLKLCVCLSVCADVCVCGGAALGVCAKMRVLNYTKCICARLNRPMIYFGSGIGGIRMMNLCLEGRVCDVFV